MIRAAIAAGVLTHYLGMGGLWGKWGEKYKVKEVANDPTAVGTGDAALGL